MDPFCPHCLAMAAVALAPVVSFAASVYRARFYSPPKVSKAETGGERVVTRR